MRIPLVGQSYAPRSPAAAAQTCVNLIPEPTQDPNERAKGFGALYGTPGRHLFKDLTAIDAGATPFRGELMVNGHLFVVAGTKFFEVDYTGALVGSIFTVTYDAANPVALMFTNGGASQIMVVTAGVCHVYDGFSMNTITLPQFTGKVLTDGKVVYWMSGDRFDPAMVAQSISIDGRNFTVASVLSPEVLTLTTTVALTISAATNANPVELTTSISHALLTGAGVTISGATGNWTPINGTSTITVTAANKFTIPVNSTTFGALTGTVLADLYDTTYQCSILNMRSISGAVLDGYFIVAREQSTKFNISPLLDGSNNGTWIWDQADFSNKESSPGYLRSVLAANEQLYLFGVDGFEVWQNTGAGVGGFPFERINGASSNIGSISKWGPIDLGGIVGFVGGHKGRISAYLLNGFTPIRISTFAEEYAWNAASLGENCVSWSYTEEGHVFWCITFTTQTWVYDLTTKLWHQRYRWNGSAFVTYGLQYHVFAENSYNVPNDWGLNGKHLVGGDGTGKVFQLSMDFGDDETGDMRWQRAVPYQYAEGKRIYFGRQTLEMETGTIPSGAEPVISRDYSDDRGHTFSTPQTAGIGTAGQYTKRVFWPTGGSSYNRLWRYSGSGQHKVALIALDSEQEAGAV